METMEKIKYIPLQGIDEELAKRANDMNSFREYQEGETTRRYESFMEIAKNKIEKHKKFSDSSIHKKIDRNFLRYEKLYLSSINKENSIRARYPSVMIAGGSNFDNRKKEKQNNAYDNMMRDRIRIAAILEKILTFGTGGISSSDSDAIGQLKKKLEQEIIKRDNAPKGHYHKAYASKEIKRINQRITELEFIENRKDVIKSNHFEVIEDKDDMRIRLIFEDKPSDEIRTILKSNGFKWSPKNTAWQRLLNINGLRAVKYIDKELTQKDKEK